MGNKILFVLTSHEALGDTGRKTGYDLSEVSHPYQLLAERGFEIDFVSPQGGEPPVDPKSHDMEDAANKAFQESETAQEKLRHTMTPEAVDPQDYAAIYYAGGHGAMWDLPDNEALAQLAAKVYEQGGVVAAVCHGPAGLLNVKLSNGLGLIEGAQISCFTDNEEQAVGLQDVVPFLLESRMKALGAEHTKATGDFRSHVAVSERLVTGQNPASARGVGEAMAALMHDRAAASG
jgi:putative intracellular protease/amidase